jgi:hypothetical protein
MEPPDDVQSMPWPNGDRITQRALAALLGISETTASSWAKDGRLRRYEHGVSNSGRRRYSIALVRREQERCWKQAIRSQDELLAVGER